MSTFDMIDLLRTLEATHYEARTDGKAAGCILDMIETIKDYYDLKFCEGCSKLYEEHHLVSDNTVRWCSNCAPRLHAEAEKDARDSEVDR